MKKRRTWSREFKLEALKTLARGEKSAADLARELGIPRNWLYRWRKQLEAQGEDAFRGSGRGSDQAAENARLRRELVRVTEERDILKKAAQFFAKDPK